MVVYFLQGSDEPSVKKRYICILQHTSYNQYTFRNVKQMSNYMSLINCKFRVRGDISAGKYTYTSLLMSDVSSRIRIMNHVDPTIQILCIYIRYRR